jgi:hypothetical protein
MYGVMMGWACSYNEDDVEYIQALVANHLPKLTPCDQSVEQRLKLKRILDFDDGRGGW